MICVRRIDIKKDAGALLENIVQRLRYVEFFPAVALGGMTSMPTSHSDLGGMIARQLWIESRPAVAR